MDLSSAKIKFSFENKNYEMSANVKEFFYIQLPDNRILRVNSWRESFPPQPTGFEVVEVSKEQTVQKAYETS